MVPRRNPEISVVVLQEHGDWGSNSAKIAQAIVTVYVNKIRRQNHNVLQRAGDSKPVEVGAIWSTPAPSDPKHTSVAADQLHEGHFFVNPTEAAAVVAGKETSPASLLAALPLRRRERLP
jgi:penicillin-binding protein 2